MFKKALTTVIVAGLMVSASPAVLAERCSFCDFSDEPIIVTPKAEKKDHPEKHAAKPVGSRDHRPFLKPRIKLNFGSGGDHRDGKDRVRFGFVPQFRF